jgi:Zn-dependent protease/predicted transcriptional regulator
MKGTVPCGRLAGIPLGVHWSALVTVAVLAYTVAVGVLPQLAPGSGTTAYWTAGVSDALLLMASLVAHELAHAVVAMRLRVRVVGMTLWLLGGRTELDGETSSSRSELLVTIAGPLASIAIGTVFAVATELGGMAGWPPLVLACLGWLALVNIVLALFNLLPAAPLDGGRVLHALLWRRSGDRSRATRTTSMIGRLTGSLVLGFGFVQLFAGDLLTGIWLAMIGWFLMSSATAEASSSLVRAQLAGVTARAVMEPPAVTAPSWFTVEAFMDTVADHTRQRVYAVVDFTGHPVGVLSLGMLAGRPSDRLRTLRVADVCRKLADVPVAAPDDEIVTVLAGVRRHPGIGMTLVLDGGALVGVISDDDIARTIELTRLHGVARPHVELPGRA